MKTLQQLQLPNYKLSILCSEIPAAPALGIFIYIPFDTVLHSYHFVFIDKKLMITRNLFNQEFQMRKLKSSR